MVICLTDDEKRIVVENSLNESEFYLSFLNRMLNSEKISEEEKEKLLSKKVRLEKSVDRLSTLLSNSNIKKSR